MKNTAKNDFYYSAGFSVLTAFFVLAAAASASAGNGYFLVSSLSGAYITGSKAYEHSKRVLRHLESIDEAFPQQASELENVTSKPPINTL